MNPLKRGLRAVKEVKKHKLLFVLLVVIQILFIVSVSFVGVTYQVKIYENAKGIIGPLENIDYESYNTEDPGQPAMKEMMGMMVSVTKSYKEMVKNIFEMLLLLLGFFLVFNGLIWSLVNRMIVKGKLLFYWGRFVLVSLVFLAPVSLVGYFILKSLIGVELELFGQGIKIMGWFFLVVCYFMLIGFCLVEERVLSLFRKIFLIGVKKAHWVLLGLSCYLLVVLLSLVLIYFSMDRLLLMILSGLILAVVLVLGKLFLAGVVKGIKEQYL